MPSGLRRIQLRTRVLAGVVLVTMVALGAFDVAAVTALRGYLIGQTDTSLRTVLRENPAPARAAGPGGGLEGSVRSAIAPPVVYGQYSVTFVSGRGRQVDLEAAPVGLAMLPRDVRAIAARQRASTVYSRDGKALARVQAIRVDAGTLVASASLGNVNQTVGRLELIVAVGSAAACLLVFLGVGLVMRRGLRPVEVMAGAGRPDLGRRPDRQGQPAESEQRGGPAGGGAQRDARAHRDLRA